MNPNTVR